MRTFRSNCIIQAVKAKIRGGKNVRILHLISNDGLHHFAWKDLKTGAIYDFHQTEEVKHWLQLLYYKGEIRRWNG